jgi:CheY-like chemotaxis protein
LEHACQDTPKLILIDTDHPPRESLALARSLRDEPDLTDTQIVVVTSEDQIGSQSRHAGNASDYLISRNDSAGIMELLADLGSSIERPLLRRAHTA